MALAAMMLLLDSFAIPFLFLIGIGMAILYNMGTNILFGEISFITMAIAAAILCLCWQSHHDGQCHES